MNYTDLNLWFSWKGRVNRRPYFFAGLALFGLIKGSELVPQGMLLFYLPVILVCLYMSIALGVKRCHDRERSGWFLLLNLVPLVNLWPFVELVFLKGTTGPNQYGDDPLTS